MVTTPVPPTEPPTLTPVGWGVAVPSIVITAPWSTVKVPVPAAPTVKPAPRVPSGSPVRLMVVSPPDTVMDALLSALRPTVNRSASTAAPSWWTSPS